MKIVEVERLLKSHTRLINALEMLLQVAMIQPPAKDPAENLPSVKEARAAIEGAHMVREEIGRP